MALNIDDELNLPLSEFVKLPTTVDFQVLNLKYLPRVVPTYVLERNLKTDIL